MFPFNRNNLLVATYVIEEKRTSLRAHLDSSGRAQKKPVRVIPSTSVAPITNSFHMRLLHVVQWVHRASWVVPSPWRGLLKNDFNSPSHAHAARWGPSPWEGATNRRALPTDYLAGILRVKCMKRLREKKIDAGVQGEEDGKVSREQVRVCSGRGVQAIFMAANWC